LPWFKKPERKLVSQRRDIPSEVWEKCGGCGEILYRGRVEENHLVCPGCGHHFRATVAIYERTLLDGGKWTELIADGMRSADPLGFIDSKTYVRRIETAMAKGGLNDGIRVGRGLLDGRSVCLGIMDFTFIGGSMGSVVGEKIKRLVSRAVECDDPLIIVSASGGARMQEGILSLMQMAKTAAALRELGRAGLPYISILTNPTTGGVTASYAMLGDVILAEPGALVGFAGPRVIKETIRQDLPAGFQRSEFLQERGMVDRIVPRGALKRALSVLFDHMC